MNKGRKGIKIGFTVLAATVIFLIAVFKLDARAGFGDFNDYDSGGYDGGYDSGYDSSYDSDWSSSYDSDYHGTGGGNLGSTLTMAIVIANFVIIMAIVMLVQGRINRMKSMKRPAAGRSTASKRTLPDRTDEIDRIIRKRDPMFTAPDFLSFARQVYMDIQSAWEKRDLTPVRSVLHQNLYQQTNRQIQKKIQDGIVNHLERISINTAYLTSLRQDKEYEYLTIYLAASMIDYQVKEATGEVLFGDKTTRWNLRYKMTFMRSMEAKTRSAREKDQGFVCPNCGAPLKGTSFGECEYCGSVVTTGAYDWVLSSFGVVKDDTVDEGIRLN